MPSNSFWWRGYGIGFCLMWLQANLIFAADYQVEESDNQIQIETPHLSATIRKRGYVTGVAGGSLVDKKTGARDLGFGLDIADWIMEPGSDEAYRADLRAAGNQELIYEFGNSFHGKTPKRAIEGPQICTQAKSLTPEIVRGPDFVAIRQSFQYRTAAPGKQVGSRWTQLMVFPADKRYFVSMHRIDSVNASEAAFLRIDMPGHIRHQGGDSFSEVYLSYHGTIPSAEFLSNFAPDEKFNYTRGRNPLPARMIRGYHIRDRVTGATGPWLAGMTLRPEAVSEAWCHQRGYVCLIEEFGGRPIRAGENFSAAFVVGFFDSTTEMQQVYDKYRGASGIEATSRGWSVTGR